MEALELYRAHVQKLSMCSDAEFQDWLARYRTGDEEAGRSITGSCLGMVLALVESRTELPSGLTTLETVQEANAALAEAIDTFSGTTRDEFQLHLRESVRSWLEQVNADQS